MKILVRGDIHLDLVSDGVPRLDEQVRVLEYTVAEIRRLQPDVFVDLGDLFDRPRPSPAAYAVAVDYASRVAANGGGFLLAGNHDKVSRGEVSALRPLEVLYRYAGGFRPFVHPEFLDSDGIRLIFLPFVTDWEGRKYLDHENASAQMYLDDFATRALEDCERAVAFTHLEVPGSRLADDERVQRDVGTRIPEVLLTDDRVLRVYAGHVHKYQELERVTVVGSAIHVDFGEATDPKGMVYAEV